MGKNKMVMGKLWEMRWVREMTSLLFLVLGLFVMGASSFSQSRTGVPICVIPKYDGDKTPFPVAQPNSKFELVDGESYVLIGFIQKFGSDLYFQIDFNAQPWLRTNSRKIQPFLKIHSVDSDQLLSHLGKRVEFALVYHQGVLKQESGRRIDTAEMVVPPARIQ